MKKLFIVFILLFLCGCSKDFYKSYSDCQMLSKDHIYKEINLDELYNMANEKKDFVVYYGNTDCAICVGSVGVFDINAKNENIDVIYYLNSKKLNSKEKDALGINLKIDEGNDAWGSPRLWIIDDGVFHSGLHDYFNGESSYDEASKKLFKIFMEEVK